MTSPGTPEPDEAALEPDETVTERDIDAVEAHIPERMEGELGSFAEHLVPMGGRMVREMGEIANEMGTEDEAEDRLLAGIEHAVTEQPSAVSDGVDLTEIKGVEPDFDPTAFRTIARETFLKVREARSTEREQEDDSLLTPFSNARSTTRSLLTPRRTTGMSSPASSAQKPRSSRRPSTADARSSPCASSLRPSTSSATTPAVASSPTTERRTASPRCGSSSATRQSTVRRPTLNTSRPSALTAGCSPTGVGSSPTSSRRALDSGVIRSVAAPTGQPARSPQRMPSSALRE